MFDYQRISEKLQSLSSVLIKALLWVLRRIDAAVQGMKSITKRILRRTQKKVLKKLREKTLVEKILMSVGMAVTSSFSLCLFHYMRTAENVEAYYIDTSRSFCWDVVWTQTPLFAGLTLALFFLIFLSLHFSVIKGKAVWFTAAPLAFNMIISLSMEHGNLSHIFLPADAAIGAVALNVLAFIGFSSLIATGIAWTFFTFDLVAEKRNYLLDEEPRYSTEFLLSVAMLTILVGWIPVLIMCYPGTLRRDTLVQIESYMGARRLQAAHPILPTLFYGFFFSIGRDVSNDNVALFKTIVFQDLGNLIIMAYTAVRVYRYSQSIPLFILTLLFFGYTPAWNIAAQQALKDVLHTGWYLLFYLEFLNCLNRERSSPASIAWLCLCGLMITFTRHAAYYLAVLCILVLVISKRKQFFAYLLCLAVVFAVFNSFNKLVIPRLDIEPEKERENYSMQIQQISLYCREYGDELTEDEKRIINGTLDFDTIVEKYSPMISDDMKATFHGDAEAHAEFWDLYGKLVKRHPLLFVKSILMTSFEHINPWYDNNFFHATVGISSDGDFHNASYPNKNVYRMNAYWQEWSKYPLARLMCGNGLSAWILIVMLGYALKNRSGRMILGLTLPFFLLAGLFMSHVNGELRYGFPLVADSPVVIAYAVYIRSKQCLNTQLSTIPQ